MSKVEIYKYDLTKVTVPPLHVALNVLNFPLSHLSAALLNIEPERSGKYGAWHTAIVVYDYEYSFGLKGVRIEKPVSILHSLFNGSESTPDKIDYLGRTNVEEDSFDDYVRYLGNDRFRSSRYNLLSHNCNTFSNTLCQYLLDRDIPLLWNIIG